MLNSRSVDSGLMLVVLIWGFHFAVVKQALFTLNPLAFAVTRFSLAALTLFLLVWIREGSIHLRREDWGAMLFLGAIGGVNQLLWLYGLYYTTSGKSALLVASAPAFMALMRAMKGERIGWKAALSLSTAFIGVALIVNIHGNSAAGRSQLLGDLLTMGAAVTWALYANTGPRLLQTYTPVRITAYVFAITALMTAVPGWKLALATPWAELSLSVWSQFLYSTFFGAALAWVLWYSGVSSIGPMKVILYQYLVPVVALIVSVFWMREPLGLSQVVGAGLVLAGTIAARALLSRKESVR